MDYANIIRAARRYRVAVVPEVASAKRACVVCDADITRDFGRCTNSCCAKCHARHCTPGGVTYPGHGLNVKAARFAHQADLAKGR